MGILDRLAKGAESIVEGAADVAGSRAVTGITTGLLSAKIKNSEANDALKANVLARVGDTLLSETIPNAIEAEKIRRTNYSTLESNYGTNFANVADASQFTLNDDTMKQLEELLKENKLDDKALENAKFETDFNTRYQTRTQTFEEKYNPILKKLGIDNIGALGYNTVESLVGNKQPMQMKADDMAKGPVPSDAFSSMQVRDYLDPISSALSISEGEFSKVAQNFRGFDEFIKPDPAKPGEFIVVGLTGSDRNEYNALRAVAQELAPQYVDEKGNVAVSAAVSAASAQLDRQTKDIIFGKTTASGYVSGMLETAIVNNKRQLTGKLSENLRNMSVTEQREYFQNGLLALGSMEEQKYFAETFPANVAFNDGTSIRDFLLRLSGITRVNTNQ